jgi:uncharacterized membrane protein (UPF0127 family)
VARVRGAGAAAGLAAGLLLFALLAPLPAAGVDWRWLALPDGSRLKAEVKATPEERRQGLMFRPSLPPDRLMLFSYPADGTRRIWMKNCRFAIDVAWLDADGRVVGTARSLPPCPRMPCPEYGPDVPARHFVEGTEGWLEAHGVVEGTRIGLGEAAAP